MWPMILLMSRLPAGHSCLRAGDRKSSATNSRQSAGRHYQAIGADRTQRSSTGLVGDTVKGPRYPGASPLTTLFVNNRKKTSVYHTVNGDRALFHTSKTAKINNSHISATAHDLLT